MKRIILTVLIAALFFSLCACGSAVDDQATQDSAAIRTNFDAACAYVKSQVDTSEMTSTTREEGNGMYQYWTYSGEGTNEVGTDVNISGKTVTLSKTTVNDLKELGFEVDLTLETIKPDAVQGFTIKKGKKFCGLAIHNLSDKEADPADLPIFQFTGGSDDESLDYAYNGIKKDSTLKDVIYALDIPKSNITISGDVSGTTIVLNYVDSATEDGVAVTDSLDIYMRYNPKKNNATVTNLNLVRYETDISDNTAE